MTSKTVTLAVNGELSLEVFSDEISNWWAMVRELSAEIARDAEVGWFLEDLHSSSAIITARGETTEVGNLERIAQAYTVVARALQRDEPIPYSPKVQVHAYAIIRHINERMMSIRFETADDDVTIIGNRDKNLPVQSSFLRAYGAVTGRIQTLSSRRRSAFTMYDSLFDKAVNCYLLDGQEDLIRDKWDHRATVEGIISRDPMSGRPVVVRNIRDITVVPDDNGGDYSQARGVIPLQYGDERPEETIRRLRDAW